MVSKTADVPDAVQTAIDLFPDKNIEELFNDHSISGITLFPQRRLKKSWYLKVNRLTGQRELHFPAILETSPENIKTDLVLWVKLLISTKRISTQQKAEKKRLERSVLFFLSESAQGERKIKGFKNALTVGHKYDLNEVYTTINHRFFNESLHAEVRWGSAGSKTSYQQTKTDVSGAQRHFITIADIYNHLEIPRFAIESIMFHEMLHIAIPPKLVNGRRVVHGAEFKTAERAFPHYSAWRTWEKGTLPRMAKSLKKTKRKWKLWF